MINKTLISALVVIIIFLIGCRNASPLIEKEQEMSVPEWVSQRPIDNSYYIGIGSCDKKTYPTDFSTVAKKNALSDMASSVSVRVQGESFLNTLEVNKIFSEDFRSNINTSTDIVFDDFETVSTFDNGKEYWIYVRISKYDYQAQQAQKKKAALDKAFDFYQRGNIAIDKLQIAQATDMWLHGLFAMKSYWSENNPYTIPSGESIILDQEIYNSLQKHLSEIQLSFDESSILLTSKDRFSRNVNIVCSNNGKGCMGVPVQYHFPTERYMKPKKVVSSNNGKAEINVQGIPMDTKQPQLEISIDINALIPSDLNENICKSLLQSSLTQTLRIPITLVKPSFCIIGQEMTFNQTNNQALLAKTIESFLAQKGYNAFNLSQKEKADFIIEISSNTIDAGISSEFSSANLEMTLTMKEQSNQTVRYQNTTNSIKGVQLNSAAASNEAYKKAKLKLEEEWLKAMIQSIL